MGLGPLRMVWSSCLFMRVVSWASVLTSLEENANELVASKSRRICFLLPFSSAFPRSSASCKSLRNRPPRTLKPLLLLPAPQAMAPQCFIIQKTLTSHEGSGRYDDLTESTNKIMAVHSTLKSANAAAEAMTHRAAGAHGGATDGIAEMGRSSSTTIRIRGLSRSRC